MIINDPNLMQQVIKYLTKNQQTTEIKKVLYCMCTNRWEKDTEYLDSINFQYLVEQVTRENCTLESFRLSLQNLIKSINKPQQYVETAKIIYLTIGQIYPEFRQEHMNVSMRSGMPTSDTNKSPGYNDTQISTQVLTQKSYQDVSSISNNYHSIGEDRDESPAQDSNYVDKYPSETYSETDLSEIDRIEEATNEAWTVPEYDLFILRQNVMNSTNPLRSKIILLVMLQPDLNLNSSLTTTMKNHQIDDLLLEVLKSHQSIQAIEENIMGAIEKMVDLEEYARTANGLLQSLAPIYVKNKI